MVNKEKVAKLGGKDGKERRVAWAECGAVTRTDQNANREPSRLHWTCHCRLRPGKQGLDRLKKA